MTDKLSHEELLQYAIVAHLLSIRHVSAKDVVDHLSPDALKLKGANHFGLLPLFLPQFSRISSSSILRRRLYFLNFS